MARIVQFQDAGTPRTPLTGNVLTFSGSGNSPDFTPSGDFLFNPPGLLVNSLIDANNNILIPLADWIEDTSDVREMTGPEKTTRDSNLLTDFKNAVKARLAIAASNAANIDVLSRMTTQNVMDVETALAATVDAQVDIASVEALLLGDDTSEHLSNTLMELADGTSLLNQRDLEFGCFPTFNAARIVDVSIGSLRDITDTYTIQIAAIDSIDLDTNGAGGLDTGTVAADTFYSIWIIGDDTDTNSPDVLASVSETSPTMPAGYDRRRRVGWVLTDASSNVHRFITRGSTDQRVTRYSYGRPEGAVFTNQNVTSYTTQSLASWIPLTSTSVSIEALVDSAGTNYLELRPTGSGIANDEGRRVTAQQGDDFNSYWFQPVGTSRSIDWRKNNGNGDASLFVWGYEESI